MKKTTFIFVILAFILSWQASSQITTYPYLEDFEAGDGGWIVDNTPNGSWALGTPATTVINSAASGANSWATNLIGDYNNDDDSSVTSPVFDLSSLTSPTIELSIWWESETNWDGAVLQSSINSGTTWENVGAFGDLGNWYTSNSIAGNPGGQSEGWSGRNGAGSNGWVTARHDLSLLAGETNVIFRIAFGSDNSVTGEGVAFDDISIFNVPCPEPVNLVASTTSDSTADITWDAGGMETEWQISLQTAGTGVPTTDGTVTTLNAPYQAIGLTAATTYEVYVRANCGSDGFSSWVGPVNFTTLNIAPPAPVGVTCTTGASTPLFTEDFGNDTNTDPIGWTGTGFSGTNGQWDITAQNGNSFGTGPNVTWDGNPGMHLEYEGSGSATDIASAISPPIDLSTAVDGAELSFWMHAFGADFGLLNIGVSTSQTGPFTTEYSWVGDLQISANELWTPIGVNLDAYLGQVIYIEFSYGGAGTGFLSDMAIDQVRVETCGDFCVAPSDVMVSGVTDIQADIAWTANSAETAWEIVVQPAGTGTPTGPGTAVTTNPYTATALTPSTNYEVYILADCGNGQSVWAGPINFTTTNTPPPPPVGVVCASGNSTFVFTEDFGNDANTDPIGWTGTGFAGTNGQWDITGPNANSFGTGPNITWDGNTGMHLEYEGSGNATDIASAISPAIDLTAAVDGAELSFWMHAFGDDIGTLNVGVSTAAAGPFTTEYIWIGDFQNTADQPWVEIGVNLDAYLGQIIYLEFSYGGTGAGFDADIAIDQIRVETCGNFCIAPASLVVSGITDITADIAWTTNNGETAWEIAVQPAGTGTPTGPGTAVTTNPFTATGLTQSTDYEVYILAVCSNGQSVWTGPINFTTLNTPPPVPVGVTCVTGSSTFVFTEDFGTDGNVITPIGWTGNFGPANGEWDITNENANSNGTGPNVTWDGNPGTHLEYEGSGSATDIAAAISPAIDLTTAIDGAELSFWMHAFGDDIGTLNVGVSTTAATGPFTTEYTWIGNLQNTADQPWVQVGVNLDAYMGQVIYLQFSFGGTGNGFQADIAIDQVRVEACGTFCIQPSNITLANITTNSADLTWTPSGPETQWNYAIQPAGSGIPATWITSSTTTVAVTGLNPATDYEVYVQAICGTDTSLWAGPVNFSTDLQFNFNLDCALDGPQTISYCYDNNDINVFTFTSIDGTPLNITLNAGQVENNFDEVVILDSDGVTDLNAATPYGNAGDLTGLTYQSTGGTISFQVQSDGSVNCQTNGFTTINLTVTCATCINHQVDFTTTTDCANGANQFFVNADITSIGDAMSLDVTDNQGSPLQSVTTTGIVTFGPYALNTNVILTVANTDDINCVRTSSVLNVPLCPPANDECTDAIVVIPNPDTVCTNITSAILSGATTSSQANVCAGTANDDVWFQFTATATDHVIDITNVIGDTQNLNHGLFEGTDCNNLTNIYCELTNSSTANGLIIGNTYYIRIYTGANVPFQNVTFDLCIITIPPPISVDETTYTPTQLVTDILVNSPCAIISNVVSTTGTDFGSVNGIAQFEANGSAFPFQSGIIMSTGDVLEAPGPETGTQSTGGWPGDSDLEAVIQQGATNDASIIQFDFTPLINQISFNFIFASEEYGDFQCGFSDAFAFLLTDLTTGITTNLAVIPGTTDPVSVFTIRDNQFNGACPSVNPTLFAEYYDILSFSAAGIGLNPIDSPIDFRGRTVPLVATSSVIPNNPYSIKLVVADDGDSAFNSVVFLEAGSFDIGQIDLGADILINSGMATCEGTPVTLDIGVTPPVGSVITWFSVDNGITEPIPGETGPTLVVNTSGVFQVDITFPGVNSACFFSDEIIVEFFPLPDIETGLAPEISACDTDNSGIATFDLTQNETVIIGTQTDIIVTYHNIEQDAIDGINPITNPSAFTSLPTTIYFRLTNSSTSCFKVDSFDLVLEPKPILVQAPNVLGCDTDIDGIAIYDITVNESTIIAGQTGFIFTYHTTLIGAQTSTDLIADPLNFESPIVTVFVRVQNAATGCFETTTFDLELAPKPVLVQAPNVLGCDTDIDGIAIYDITVNESTIIAGQTGFTFTYHTTLIGAQTSTDLIADPLNFESPIVTVFVRVQNDATGCFETTTFDLELAPKPVLVQGDDILGCDNDNDGIADYDLTVNEAIIVAGQTGFIFSYHTSLLDAQTGMAAITDPVNYQSATSIIYVRVEDGTNSCFETTTFELLFGISPETTSPSNIVYEVCPNATVPITISAEAVNYTDSEVSIVWFDPDGIEIPGQTTLDLSTVLVGGDYEILVTFNDTGCSQSAFIQVNELETCVIPQGISPNGDGINDNFDLSSYDVQSLEIFNRYGRLVYSKVEYSSEWVGQSNDGDMLPVGTYYYVMKFQGDQQRAAWIYLNR